MTDFSTDPTHSKDRLQFIENSNAYDHDSEIVSAAWASILILLAIILTIAFFVSVLRLNSNWLTGPLVYGLAMVETGMAIFLIHSFHLFPHNAPNRFFGIVGTLILVGFQIAVLTNGFGVLPSLAYSIGLGISGWLLQRFTGACLSMNGEDVYQPPLNTMIFLLLPLLLLLMGVVPVILSLALMPGSAVAGGPASLAPMFIYTAMGMIASCLVPLLCLYAWLVVMRCQPFTKIVLGIAGIVLVLCIVATEWSFGSRDVVSLYILGSVAPFSLGLGIGYFPFHYVGFRPVWAKRQIVKIQESEVSFDDID